MFIVGGTNDREREGSQVSKGMVERMPRAWSLLGRMRDVLCVELICPKSVKKSPFSGEACPPFYRPRGEQGLQMGEKVKTRGQEAPSPEGVGSSFPAELASLTWPDGVRDWHVRRMPMR